MKTVDIIITKSQITDMHTKIGLVLQVKTVDIIVKSQITGIHDKIGLVLKVKTTDIIIVKLSQIVVIHVKIGLVLQVKIVSHHHRDPVLGSWTSTTRSGLFWR